MDPTQESEVSAPLNVGQGWPRPERTPGDDALRPSGVAIQCEDLRSAARRIRSPNNRRIMVVLPLHWAETTDDFTDFDTKSILEARVPVSLPRSNVAMAGVLMWRILLRMNVTRTLSLVEFEATLGLCPERSERSRISETSPIRRDVSVRSPCDVFKKRLSPYARPPRRTSH